MPLVTTMTDMGMLHGTPKMLGQRNAVIAFQCPLEELGAPLGDSPGRRDLRANPCRRKLTGYFLILAALCFCGVAYTAPFAYITNLGSNDVSVIDLAQDHVVATIPVGKGPASIAVHAASQRAYVTARGKSLVEWRGAFYRGYPDNDPPPDRNDEAAEKAITGIYKTGLENLKTVVEQ